MKKLAINIDWILRDFAYQFDTIYRKRFITNPSIVGMNEDMTVKEKTDEELEDDYSKYEALVKEKITMPIDSFDLLNHYKFEPTFASDGVTLLTPREHLEKFMYDDYPFQIFAVAPAIEKAVEAVNKIQQFGDVNGLYKTSLVCKLKGKSICSTLSFLAKENCRIKNINFVDEDYEKWDNVDVLVDVSPEAIQNKPTGKIVIKINNPANQWDEADFSFNNIKDLYDEGFLRRLFEDSNKNYLI